MKDPRDEIIQKFFKWLFLGDINELRECEEMINEYENNKEETEQEIDARFLRGKQDEIDNLRKEVERLEYKEKRYTDKLLESFDKIKELETDLEHRDSILSKAYDLIAYPWLSDTKKIDILRKVINIEVGASYEPDEDVTNFHKRIYKCKKWPQWVTWASN